MALYSSVGGIEGDEGTGLSKAMLGYSFALTDESKFGPSN